MKILHLDKNHPLLIERLAGCGFLNHIDYSSDKEEVEKIISQYQGVILRSRFSIDRFFLEKATRLKFIGRVGAGLENIDIPYAKEKGIHLISVPEGNRNAVAEHALGMLLTLFRRLNLANSQVKAGKWSREENRGEELDGKTVGIIGYGNTGKAFARKLSGFQVEVICYDILPDIGDRYCKQVTLEVLLDKAEVLSLHVPQNPETIHMVDAAFIDKFRHPFWLLNTARGRVVSTKDLVGGLMSAKILGAGLDVLEFEKTSFESLFEKDSFKDADFQYLVQSNKVLLTPHIAGWTHQSKKKLAISMAEKIQQKFPESSESSS